MCTWHVAFFEHEVSAALVAAPEAGAATLSGRRDVIFEKCRYHIITMYYYYTLLKRVPIPRWS